MEDKMLRKAISDISLHKEGLEAIRQDNPEVTAKIVPIEQVECECCGHNEECSFSYIKQVKDIHYGRWVCGLCSEAVKERLTHSPMSKMVLRDAISLHKEFCDEFNNTTRINPQLSLTCALKGIAKRSSQHRILSKDEKLPFLKLARSASCVPRIEVYMRENHS